MEDGWMHRRVGELNVAHPFLTPIVADFCSCSKKRRRNSCASCCLPGRNEGAITLIDLMISMGV